MVSIVDADTLVQSTKSSAPIMKIKHLMTMNSMIKAATFNKNQFWTLEFGNYFGETTNSVF